MEMSNYYRQQMEEALELARRYERCPEDQQKAAGAADARRTAEFYRNLMEEAIAEENMNNEKENTMNTNTANVNIKDLLGNGEMNYDIIHTEGPFEWFKNNEDAYIYVMNTQTKRATRYNAEAQNGKRISANEYETIRWGMLQRYAELDAKMRELGYQRIDSGWNDIRYSTCDGQSKVMAFATKEEGLTWADAQITPEDIERDARELEAYIANAEEDAKTEEGKEIADLYCRHPEGTDLQVPAILNQYGCVDCSKCNVQNCVHRDCMRRNPVSEGGLAECPRLKVSREQELDDAAEDPKVSLEEFLDMVEDKPKAKKAKKNAAFTYTVNGEVVVTLTEKQVDFVKHLPDTCFWEDGLNSCIWVDCLCDDIGGQFAGKPMTVGAMISTLCEKGLAIRSKNRVNGKKCTGFALSPLGKQVFAGPEWGLC